MLHWLGWILVELAFLHSDSKPPWFLVGPSNLPPPGLCHAVKCCDGNWLSPGDIYTKRWSKWNDPQIHVELLLLGSFWSHQGNFRFVLWWSRSTFVDNQSLYQTNFCVFSIDCTWSFQKLFLHEQCLTIFPHCDLHFLSLFWWWRNHHLP